MMNRIFGLLMIFGLSFGASACAEDIDIIEEEVGHTEEDFDAAEYAIHHALDAHDIHIADGFVIPLPVILYTDNGLVTFMSSEFHHDDAGHHIVSKNGMNFVKIHEKIYQLEEGATEVVFNEEHHPENAHQVAMDLSITKNTITMFLVAGLLLWLFIASARKYKTGSVPRGIAKWTEPGVIFVQEIAKDNIEGDKYKRYTPFLLTLFFFILFGNLLGLIPFLANPNMTGSISMTLLLATITFVVQMASSKGPFWKHILLPDAPVWLYPILVPIEIAGIFIKPIALMIRLFANITAGHIIVISLIGIIFVNQHAGWAGLSVPMTLFISTLELLVAFLQAYIFTMLAALYIGSAVESGHHH
ncbi:MAG: F0F1 ATP synthase subunit A [Crocinitomicaceae bacterium]|nr:F0F1 ATP synthase subunit A [Crocinitomicaceae bacterium]